jgi:hypothetical protein
MRGHEEENFRAELKRRSVCRVVIACGVVA